MISHNALYFLLRLWLTYYKLREWKLGRWAILKCIFNWQLHFVKCRHECDNSTRTVNWGQAVEDNVIFPVAPRIRKCRLMLVIPVPERNRGFFQDENGGGSCCRSPTQRRRSRIVPFYIWELFSSKHAYVNHCLLYCAEAKYVQKEQMGKICFLNPLIRQCKLYFVESVPSSDSMIWVFQDNISNMHKAVRTWWQGTMAPPSKPTSVISFPIRRNCWTFCQKACSANSIDGQMVGETDKGMGSWRRDEQMDDLFPSST